MSPAALCTAGGPQYADSARKLIDAMIKKSATRRGLIKRTCIAVVGQQDAS
jgi:hypothetical protein